jgi:DNA primase
MDKSTEIEAALNSKDISFKIVGDNYMISCIFHDDTHPSLGISREGIWNCFSCGSKGNWQQFAKEIGIIADEVTFADLVNDKLNRRNDVRKKLESTGLPHDFMPYNGKVPMHVKERISLDNIATFEIGEATMSYPGYFVIPIRYGDYVTYTCRHLLHAPGSQRKRWMFAKGFKKILFPRPTKQMILVEGIIAAFSLIDCGLGASACFGHDINEIQLCQMIETGVEEVTLLFDRYEDHYLDSMSKAFQLLSTRFDVSVMKLDNDADEVTKREIMTAHNERIDVVAAYERMITREFAKGVDYRINGKW